MTKSEIINNILTDKNPSIANNYEFFHNLPNNYMLQRYISMTSLQNLSLLNETSNKLYDTLGDKQIAYKLYMSLIPQNEYNYKYLKKAKTKIDEESQNLIKKFSNINEVSEQQIKDWINMNERVEET